MNRRLHKYKGTSFLSGDGKATLVMTLTSFFILFIHIIQCYRP